MAVQFILGRSGAGKTSYCIESVVESLQSGGGEPLILLVPEQATYQAERAILSDKRVGGYSRLCVLSFERLEFLLCGRRRVRPEVGRLGRQMIIGRVVREKKDELGVFGSCSGRSGLGVELAEVVAEFGKYGKSWEDVEELAEELSKNEGYRLTAKKLSDIGLILKGYQEFIKGRYIDPEIELAEVKKRIGESELTVGARLWVDGFSGFTGSELEILAELMRAAKETQIALCLDGSEIDLSSGARRDGDGLSLFWPTEQTYSSLLEVVRGCRGELKEPVLLKETLRFSGSAALGHIEKKLFGRGHGKARSEGKVRVVSAANGRAEVKFIARKIVKLVREEGYRYRDIAVIASELGGYEHYIRASLADYGIPYFIDKRRRLIQHPVVQLICNGLRAVTGGFGFSDVFAYLKSGLVRLVSRDDIDLLENYCLAFGVKGSDWAGQEDWQFDDKEEGSFDEGRINKIRKRVIEPLIKLKGRICDGGGVGKKIEAEEFVRAVFDFIESLGVRETMDGWEDALEEHRQFYEKCVDVLDELAEVFSGYEMSSEDYAGMIESAFSQLSLAFIPPTLDQVLIGSIERSRHPSLKAVFLVGVTAKDFPVPVSFGRVLTESDREAFGSADFVLGPAVSEGLLERRYLAYIAFTRPSEYLYVTYPLADADGGAMVRSQFIEGLEELFEDVSAERAVNEDAGAIERVYSEGELCDFLCNRLGKDASGQVSGREELLKLLGEVGGDAELGRAGKKIFEAIGYDNGAELEDGVVKKLFGREVKTSTTKLRAFASCPYKYFARYVLELEKRKEFKLEPLDLGMFYHSVLDSFVKKAIGEGRDLGGMSDDELRGMLREELAKVVKEDRFISKFRGHSFHNAFIIGTAEERLENCVTAIGKMVGAGSFRPELSEVWFGEKGGKLGECKFVLPGGRELSLRGRIDRLDTAERDGEKKLVVFDYKRRGGTFGFSEFYYGLDMQLAVYMLAVGKSGSGKVVGAFYIPVETGAERGTLEEAVEGVERFSHKAKGIFNGEFASELDGTAVSKWSDYYNFYVKQDGNVYGHYGSSGALKPEDFGKILGFVERKITELAEGIVSGKIEVEPYQLGTRTPCGWCEYRSVCRFDWQVNDYNRLESMSKEEALKKMGAGG
ncbi:MAG: PD-(D/E)XK nuclease family protein [Planctomycetota bacterium]|jgi:ATP-dependent helicase/nuclease subunit B